MWDKIELNRSAAMLLMFFLSATKALQESLERFTDGIGKKSNRVRRRTVQNHKALIVFICIAARHLIRGAEVGTRVRNFPARL